MESKLNMKLNELEEWMFSARDDIDTLGHNVDILEEENRKMKEEVRMQAEKIDYLENQSRRQNLVFYNIPKQQQEETWDDCEQAAQQAEGGSEQESFSMGQDDHEEAPPTPPRGFAVAVYHTPEINPERAVYMEVGDEDEALQGLSGGNDGMARPSENVSRQSNTLCVWCRGIMGD
ncbi:hypothetical protein ACOMHN_063346 [Nucella lapillus]